MEQRHYHVAANLIKYTPLQPCAQLHESGKRVGSCEGQLGLVSGKLDHILIAWLSVIWVDARRRVKEAIWIQLISP